MESSIRKKITEYRNKIADCDKILEGLRFEKNGLRNKRRGADSIKGTNAEFQLNSMKKEESIVEARRQCFVQAMHDFDSLLDEFGS